MRTRVLRPALTLTSAIAVVLAALVVYAYLATAGAQADSEYVPEFDGPVANPGVVMCNALTDFSADNDLNGNADCYTNGNEDLSLGSNADQTTYLNIDTGLNFAQVITFGPGDGDISNVDTGTKVGGLNSETHLGIGNSTCYQEVDVEFNLYDVYLPPTTSDPRTDTNIALPQQEGADNRFERWDTGTGPGSSPTWATTADSIIANDGGAYATSSAVPIQGYPYYLLNLFDPDFTPGVGDGTTDDPIIPSAVYGGVTKVAGTWVPLFFAVFETDHPRYGELADLPPPFDAIPADGSMGAASVSVLNDPTAVKAFASTITDFCSPLEVTTMLLGCPGLAQESDTCGVDSGEVRWENPSSAGTGYFLQVSNSLRDLDQDSYENALDPCPAINEASIPTPTSNPKADPGASETDPLDSDGDGIPNVAGCDSTSTGILDPFFSDEDHDGFSNRLDNCPLDPNGDQNSGNPNVTPGPEQQEEEEQKVDPADSGPRTDSIGNQCDSEKGTVTIYGFNSAVGTTDTEFDITLQDNVANGRWHSKTHVVTKCFGAADNDDDGYCNLSGQDLTTDGDGDDDCENDVPVSCGVRHSSWLPSSPARQMDTDGDVYNDGQETYYGTDPVQSCAVSDTANDEFVDFWPLDFDDNQIVTGSDVLKFGGGFGNSVAAGPFGPLAGERLDLNVDGLITGSDILQMGAGFGLQCGVDGGAPPGFNPQ